MAVPASLTTIALQHLGQGHLVQVATMLAGTVVGVVAYLGAQAAFHSPELGQLTTGLRHVGGRRWTR